MAAPADVTFDVLLGGKVTPELLKSFKDLEELMKKQGATAKTINAVMGRAYKETFEGVDKESKKASESVERSWKHTATELAEKAREAREKVVGQFEKIKESMEGIHKLGERLFEFTGVSALVAAAGGALTIEELIKKGIEVHRERATQAEVLAATLRGRGAGRETPEWAEQAERIAGRAHIGHEEAMKLMTRLAASGKFKTAEQASQMAMALIGLGGGTAEGAEAARAAYGKTQVMMLAGKVRPTAIANIAGGAGLGGALLQQVSHDTGIPITDLAKQFAPAKVSKKGEVTGGALAGAKGIEALNKAILELGQSRGAELVQAHMKGMDGLFYRFSEHWEDFTDKIGEFVEKVIDPIGEEINKLIDSINFEAVFEGMIEKGKEWGQLIKAVWDTIANSPVLTRIKTMWEDFWKTFTGGVELYGPYVETWNDKLHHELGTHMARHMTEAGRQWVRNTSEKVESILKAIIGAFQWFLDHGRDVWWWIKAITLAFTGLKALEIGLWVGKLTKALLWDIPAAFTGMIIKLIAIAKGGTAAETATTVAETVAKRGAPWLPVAGAATTAALTALPIVVAELHKRFGWFGLTGAEPTRPMETGITGGAARAETNPLFKTSRQLAEEHQKTAEAAKATTQHLLIFKKATQDTSDALYGKSPGLIPGLDIATVELDKFIPAITQATVAVQQISTGFSALGGLGGALGGGAGFTGATPGGAGAGAGAGAVGGFVPGATRAEAYGPSQGEHTHDTLFGPAGNQLREGDYAVSPDLASGHSLFSMFQFTDANGRLITGRYADASFKTPGVPNHNTIEQWNGRDLGWVQNFHWLARGGIVKRPTHAVLGERGPEAVVPLSKPSSIIAGLESMLPFTRAVGPVTDLFKGVLGPILHKPKELAGARELPALPRPHDIGSVLTGGFTNILRAATTALTAPAAATGPAHATSADLGGVTINVQVAGNAHDPDGIAHAVERVIREHWRRRAVV